MTSLVADTHSILWYLSDSPQLSATAADAMDAAILAGKTVWLSSIVLVEVTYLVEKQKILPEARDGLDAQLADPASNIRCVPFDESMAVALRRVPRNLVPDMPDRLIAATALHMGLPLITVDAAIRSTNIPIIW